MPAYNCAATIAESVASIMDANFSEGDELIIVNDCSTDDTAGVFQTISLQYPQIRIIHHVHNKGGGAARNTAVENARHALLFCLDADNVLEKNSIRPLVRFLQAEQADIASFAELKYFSDSTAAPDESWFFGPQHFTLQHLLAGKLSPGASGNYLFTKDSWQKAKGYSEDLGALDTWSFGFKQLMEGCKMVVMPGSYYFHRRGHQSYYIRDAWSKRRSVSLRLIKLIINYIDRFEPGDVDYIFSARGRYTWFDRLEKRPIRLAVRPGADAVWSDHELKKSPLTLFKEKVSYYTRRLKQKYKRS